MNGKIIFCNGWMRKAIPEWMTECYYIRCEAPPQSFRSKGVAGVRYCTEQEIKHFLGYSMALLYPGDWPKLRDAECAEGENTSDEDETTK